jgi:hypothetical protein
MVSSHLLNKMLLISKVLNDLISQSFLKNSLEISGQLQATVVIGLSFFL